MIKGGDESLLPVYPKKTVQYPVDRMKGMLATSGIDVEVVLQ